MTSYPERNFGHFEINPNDKITLHGRAMRLAYQTKSGYVLKELDVTGVSELFSFVTLYGLIFPMKLSLSRTSSNPQLWSLSLKNPILPSKHPFSKLLVTVSLLNEKLREGQA